jgi:hypothetical protein
LKKREAVVPPIQSSIFNFVLKIRHHLDQRPTLFLLRLLTRPLEELREPASGRRNFRIGDTGNAEAAVVVEDAGKAWDQCS